MDELVCLDSEDEVRCLPLCLLERAWANDNAVPAFHMQGKGLPEHTASSTTRRVDSEPPRVLRVRSRLRRRLPRG
jgi:hypothetical protein